MPENSCTLRPFPITVIALLQFAKGAFLLAVAFLPLFGGPSRLASIPDLKDLLFLASHGKDPRGALLLTLGIYAIFIGSGLWRLKRWARNSLVFSTGIMLVVWLSHYDFGTRLIAMPAISEVEQQTVYILLLFDFTTFAYLKFHPAISRCFAPRRPSTLIPHEPSPDHTLEASVYTISDL